jgi:putative methionine-R-sulfoxide reductase with GAF domain
MCEEVRTAFGLDFVRIEVADLRTHELVVEAESGYGGTLVGRRIRYGEGLSGVAASSREPVLANAVAREPRYLPLRPNVRSALSLPLRYQPELTSGTTKSATAVA